MADLKSIANQFKFEGNVLAVSPLGEGFINDTFMVSTDASVRNRYILQRKNKKIFTNIPAMMHNINLVCSHIKRKIEEKAGDPLREALTVVLANDGALYYADEEGEFWAACLFIEGSMSYQTAGTPELAYQGGRGIGMFQAMVADLKTPLADILPGFHNIRFRFNQWDEALQNDRVGRKKYVLHEIEWIEQRKEEMLNFWELVEKGIIPTRVTHNDTKISNILFDEKGEVLCVIDLDTVLNSTCLNDFGDAIRSYANTGQEDDANLDNVSLSLPFFKAYATGYLSQAKSFLTDAETDYLAFSAKYITYEQVLRFLMDYINGDTYYKVKDVEHNLRRTRAQYKLLASMEDQYSQMCQIVASLK